MKQYDKIRMFAVMYRLDKPVELNGMTIRSGVYSGSIKTYGVITGAGVSWSAPAYWMVAPDDKTLLDITAMVVSGQIVVAA